MERRILPQAGGRGEGLAEPSVVAAADRVGSGRGHLDRGPPIPPFLDGPPWG